MTFQKLIWSRISECYNGLYCQLKNICKLGFHYCYTIYNILIEGFKGRKFKQINISSLKNDAIFQKFPSKIFSDEVVPNEVYFFGKRELFRIVTPFLFVPENKT